MKLPTRDATFYKPFIGPKLPNFAGPEKYSHVTRYCTYVVNVCRILKFCSPQTFWPRVGRFAIGCFFVNFKFFKISNQYNIE